MPEQNMSTDGKGMFTEPEPVPRVGGNSTDLSGKGRAQGLGLALLLIAGIVIHQHAWAEAPSRVSAPTQPLAQPYPAEAVSATGVTGKRANYKDEKVSQSAQQAANWVVDSGDNLGLPFMIVDKTHARALLFDASGQLRGAASVLLGMAVGDDSAPGIGTRKLSSIRPEERTTPAGRFVASLGRNLKNQQILWVDYENAISLHRVVTGSAKERRAERLASASIHDKRISYGCINVPVAFFDGLVIPAFTGTNGIVYVLPETRPNHAVFASYYAVE